MFDVISPPGDHAGKNFSLPPGVGFLSQLGGFAAAWRQVNQLPVASSVAIAGTEQVGETLTASYSYSDPDGDAEGTSTYQWYRADDNSGTNEAAISGATSSTYTLVSADEGKYLRVGVVPVAATGESPGVEVFSAYTGAIAGPSFTLVDSAEVTGSPAASLSTSSLGLDTTKTYLLVGSSGHSSVTAAQDSIYCNGDTTDSNYRRGLGRSGGSAGAKNTPADPYYDGSGENWFYGFLTVVDGVASITVVGGSSDADRWAFGIGAYNTSESNWDTVTLTPDAGNLEVGTLLQIYLWSP